MTDQLPPNCEGCGRKMKHLEAILFQQGIATLPVSSFGGLRSVLLCESCRDIHTAMIRVVVKKKEELAAQEEEDELARIRARHAGHAGVADLRHPDDRPKLVTETARASEVIELGAADRPPGEVDPEVRPKDPEV